MISQSTNDVVVVCSYGGTNLVKTGWNGSVHDTVPDLQTDLPLVCLLLFVLVVGLVFDEREAFVVVLVVDVGVVETHELAGTTVVFTVELVCVLPFESIEITSVSIADVIELHDVVDFRGARVVVLTVDVGVVDTHELAGTTVVFFVELVCVLPFESIEITSDSITDVIALHDVVDHGHEADMRIVLQTHVVERRAFGPQPDGARRDEAVGLQLFAAQAHHQQLAAEVRVLADVAQGALRNLGARRVDGDAAAVGVLQRHHVIHVGKQRQQFGLGQCQADAMVLGVALRQVG